MRPLSYICKCLTGVTSNPCKDDEKDDDNKREDAVGSTDAARAASSKSVDLASTQHKVSATSLAIQQEKDALAIRNNAEAMMDRADADESPEAAGKTASWAQSLLGIGQDALSQSRAHLANLARSVSEAALGPSTSEISDSNTGSACFKPPSIVEFQVPIFHCLSTQLQEAQAIIQKLEQQACEQDRVIKERAEAACKRERDLEAKLKELRKKAESAETIGNAAKALESATANIHAKIFEAQELKHQLASAEHRVQVLKDENEQMRQCIDCMKTKMLEAERCGAQSVKNWKLECEKLKADICCLRSAAEDLCEQLHEANRKCAKLEGVQSKLKDVCDLSQSPSTDAEVGKTSVAPTALDSRADTPAVAPSQSVASSRSLSSGHHQDTDSSSDSSTESSTSSRASSSASRRSGTKRSFDEDYQKLAGKLMEKDQYRQQSQELSRRAQPSAAMAASTRGRVRRLSETNEGGAFSAPNFSTNKQPQQQQQQATSGSAAARQQADPQQSTLMDVPGGARSDFVFDAPHFASSAALSPPSCKRRRVSSAAAAVAVAAQQQQQANMAAPGTPGRNACHQQHR